MYTTITTSLTFLFCITVGFSQDFLGTWYVSQEMKNANEQKIIVLQKEKTVHHRDIKGNAYYKTYRFLEKNNAFNIIIERDKQGNMTLGTWSYKGDNQLNVTFTGNLDGTNPQTPFTITSTKEGEMTLTENLKLEGSWYISKVTIDENLQSTVYLTKQKTINHTDEAGNEHYKSYNFLDRNRYYILRESMNEAKTIPGSWKFDGNQLTLSRTVNPDGDTMSTRYEVIATEEGVRLIEK